MQDGYLVTEASPEPADCLWSEGYLGDEYACGAAVFDCSFDRAQVHLGLTGTRHSVESDNPAPIGDASGDHFERLGLSQGELLVPRRAPLAGATVAQAPSVFDGNDALARERVDGGIDGSEVSREFRDPDRSCCERIQHRPLRGRIGARLKGRRIQSEADPAIVDGADARTLENPATPLARTANRPRRASRWQKQSNRLRYRAEVVLGEPLGSRRGLLREEGAAEVGEDGLEIREWAGSRAAHDVSDNRTPAEIDQYARPELNRVELV
jgi:hypothetical protein